MKRMTACLALVFAIGLGSCQLSTKIEVFNNTPNLVKLLVENDERKIRPGKSATLFEYEFRLVEAETNGIQWVYEQKSRVPEFFIYWTGRISSCAEYVVMRVSASAGSSRLSDKLLRGCC